MQVRPRRYVRRPRAWEAEAGAALDSGAGEAPRGRRRRSHFGEHIEAACALFGYTYDDEARVTATAPIVLAQVDAISDAVYRHLLGQRVTAAHFSDAAGAIDRDRVAARLATFRDWLRTMVEDPLDADTGEVLASIGLTHVRPRDGADQRVKARYMTSTISVVQTMVIAALAGSVADPVELGAAASAWSRRLLIHLDLLLAVYGSAEGTAHWY